MLERNRKGNKLKKAACKGAGRAVVDGIEPESSSMLSTVNLELSNFINPELAWKVKKGCRSATRRSRNSTNLNSNVGTEFGNSCNRDQESSESEKLGVAVLGRRFAEKLVDVPVKKRRFSITPSSPPARTLLPDYKGSLLPQPQTPQQAIKFEQIVDIKASGAGRHLSQGFYNNSKKWVLDKSLSPKLEGKVDEYLAGHASDDDFSGIELLAAAACRSSIDNNVKLVETCALKAFAKTEAVDSPNTTVPLLESIASSVTSHFSGTELVNEDDMGESVADIKTVVAVGKNKNDGVVKNRVHWDLNTVMEAWEEPDDVSPNDSQITCSEIVPGGTHCDNINIGNPAVQRKSDVLRDAERDGQSVVCKEVPSDVGCIKELADGIAVAIGRSCIDEDTLKTCSSPDGTNDEKQYLTTPERVKEALNVAVYDKIDYHPLKSIEASGNNSCTELEHHAGFNVFEEKMYASNCELEQAGEVSCGTFVEEHRKLLSVCLEVEKLKFFTPNLPHLTIIGHETNETQTKDYNFFENTIGSPNSKTLRDEVISTIPFKTSDVGNHMDELYRANQFNPSPKSEALSASSTSVGVGEGKLLPNKASAADGNAIDVALKVGPKGLLKNFDCPSKFDQDSNISGCYDKDGKKADIKHISEYEAGYDSSFEDGELREPGVYTWEENDLEVETECVDYGSDYGEDIGKVGAGENRLAEAGDYKPLEQCSNGSIRDGNHLACTEAKISGENRFNEHMEYGLAEAKADGYVGKKLFAGEFRSRSFRCDLPSYSKGPAHFDALERKTYLGVPRKRFDSSNYLYPRAGRGFGLEKSRGRGRFSYKPFVSRNETDGQRVDYPTTYRGPRNRYLQSYNGPDGHGYSRPRDLSASLATKFGGCQYEDDRLSIIYSSNNSRYRSSIGRRSPADREVSYDGQGGIPPVRGIGQDRSRGRSRQYIQGIRRVPEAEYSEDIPDDADPRPIHRQPYFCRSGRGFSPNYRGGNLLRRNSCSRSPTRSLVTWNSQRDRNMNTRRRSPDFRSDARSERIGSPLSNSYRDDEEIYLSPPNSRVPPRSNSRWFNNRNNTDNNFRCRKSPVRMYRGGKQGMDSIGYSGKRLEGIFRPNIRVGRFQKVSSTRREPELGLSIDEKCTHDNGYDIRHRVRRYDTGGAARRFRYDSNDCFEARNAHNDDSVGHAIKRDIPMMGAGEERGTLFNSGDGSHASASSAGQRDFNEDATIREE